MRVQTAANKIPEAKTGDHSVLEHSKAPAEDQAGVAESIDVDVSNQTVKPGESSDVAVQPTKKVHVGKGATTQTLPVETDPVPAPEDLRHLVLGINEVIKALEAAIEYLKILLMMISDALNTGAQQRLPTSGLLPTAPTPGTQPKLVPSLVAASPPLVFIIIPLLSISPQSLVSPIPQYCATYNSHVYQWTQLKKVVETRLKQSQWDILGPPREEVRVVPLGQVEADMAKMVGLRRLACLGIRVSRPRTCQPVRAHSVLLQSSHPDISLLHELLPKSILHPPRHSITLPFPSSTLRVHPKSTRKQDPSKPSERSSSLPLPHVHFAPLTIKGITTSVPVDGMARKQRRLEEVRQRRRETKERKKEERRKEIKLGIAGQERKDRLAKKRKALKLGPSPKKRRKVEHASKPGI